MNMRRIALSLIAATLIAQAAQAGVKVIPAGTGPAGNGRLQPVVNLNTATIQQLAYLPGVGLKLAGRIAEYRALHGPFVRVSDVRQVKGFGDKRLTAIGPYSMVSGLTTATGKIKGGGK